MLALIEQSHALIPEDLLSGRFGTGAGRQLTRGELRLWNPDRRQFASLPREPITLVLDGVRRNYNIGAMFRLADAFLLERLVICGVHIDLRKRKLVQAACGAQYWGALGRSGHCHQRSRGRQGQRGLGAGGRANQYQPAAGPNHASVSGLLSTRLGGPRSITRDTKPGR